MTVTNCPWKKYTPSSIWKDAPVIAALTGNVEANGVPASIVVLPSRPDNIVVLLNNSSPLSNTWLWLSAVLEPM